VCECDREASIMRRPWPTRGCCAGGGGGGVPNMLSIVFMTYGNKYFKL
jgi:hypothetical protein